MLALPIQQVDADYLAAILRSAAPMFDKVTFGLKPCIRQCAWQMSRPAYCQLRARSQTSDRTGSGDLSPLPCPSTNRYRVS